ncbi:MAG: DUF2892 domain-containing protein [Cytophagaceae bacterium]
MKKLKSNMSRTDKYVRIIIVTGLLVLFNHFNAPVFLLLSLTIIITVVMGWCPVYAPKAFISQHPDENIKSK